MRCSIRFVGLMVLAVGACAQPAATPTALTEEDRAAITALFATVVNTIRASDWDAFVATFDDNVVFHPANNPPLHGKEALKAWAAAGPKALPAFDFTNVQVFGEGNFAYATSDIAMAFEGMPAPDPSKQLVVLRKDAAGQWKTLAVSFNSNTPLPGMTGPPPATTTQ